MARVKLVLDTRKSSRRVDDTFPISLRIFHFKARFLKTGYYSSFLGWDEKNTSLKKSITIHKKIDFYDVNSDLEDKLYQAKKVVRELGSSIEKINVDQLIEIIKEKWDYNPESELKCRAANQITLRQWADVIIKRKRLANKPGSAEWLENCVNRIIDYNEGRDPKLYDINLTFLRNFEAYQIGKGNSTNTVAIYLGAIRTLYNSAITEDQFAPLKNSFELYKMPSTIRSRKRAISKDKIMGIKDLQYPFESPLWHAKNYAMVMFYCRGMNFMDMVKMKVCDIQDGRLLYGRSKTGHRFSIKITEDLKGILNYYLMGKRSKDYLFPTNYDGSTKHFQKYKSQRRRMNERLRIIAKDAGIESNFTTYSIRHSWATIAKYMGISTELISEAFGHSSVRVTETYLKDFDNEILDEVNVMVTS